MYKWFKVHAVTVNLNMCDCQLCYVNRLSILYIYMNNEVTHKHKHITCLPQRGGDSRRESRHYCNTDVTFHCQIKWVSPTAVSSSESQTDVRSTEGQIVDNVADKKKSVISEDVNEQQTGDKLFTRELFFNLYYSYHSGVLLLGQTAVRCSDML